MCELTHPCNRAGGFWPRLSQLSIADVGRSIERRVAFQQKAAKTTCQEATTLQQVP